MSYIEKPEIIKSTDSQMNRDVDSKNFNKLALYKLLFARSLVHAEYDKLFNSENPLSNMKNVEKKK